MIIKADPGIYLVELIEPETRVNLGPQKEKQILKGKILDVGPNRTHDSGGKLESARKAGDVIWFFSYVTGADFFEEGGKKYYTVLFNDARAHIEEESFIKKREAIDLAD